MEKVGAIWYTQLGVPHAYSQFIYRGCYVLLRTRTAPRTETGTWNDGSRFALTADRPTRPLTGTLTRTLWGDYYCAWMLWVVLTCRAWKDSRLIRPARDAVGWKAEDSRTYIPCIYIYIYICSQQQHSCCRSVTNQFSCTAVCFACLASIDYPAQGKPYNTLYKPHISCVQSSTLGGRLAYPHAGARIFFERKSRDVTRFQRPPLP